MILTSLLALTFSLFPFLPHLLGASPQAVWRISSFAYLVAAGSVAWFQFRYLRKIGTRRFGSLLVNGPLALLALLLLAANSILDMGELAPAIFIFCVFSALFVSGLLFFLTFLSVLSGSEP
jgi:hypothetical protein